MKPMLLRGTVKLLRTSEGGRSHGIMSGYQGAIIRFPNEELLGCLLLTFTSPKILLPGDKTKASLEISNIASPKIEATHFSVGTILTLCEGPKQVGTFLVEAVS